MKRMHVYVLLYLKSLVICFVSQEEIKAEKKRIKDMMQQQRINRLERPEVLNARLAEYGERFVQMDKETALKQNARNKEIRYEAIEKARYSPATEDCDGEMNILCRGRLVIVTAEGKTIIQHNLEGNAPQEQELRRGLRQINT